ncbi:methylaspartate mutase [Actinomadura latina]|uniref:Methylaspartate mutase n=1 Tax=Actinomadura latina TaxID=163603 RepID=A0A846Z5L3_9ACTN|nr:methylaspartate mutase [Actinomadura latina]NKZ08319.1 methylaspartate mutase [Actinomadura latina]
MSFGGFVRNRRAAGELVVQPRMGFGDPALMRAGLAAVKRARAVTAGTVTLDSYTRLGDVESAGRALRDGDALNGYPLLSHDAATTRAMVGGLAGDDFPVQVRHGSAEPLEIFRGMIRAGLDATEGGPVSYCLPYGRTPLAASVRQWTESCKRLAAVRETGREPHLETFGGCLMGQLCPPGLLVAVSVLEAMFFRALGLRSISVSYAQQTNAAQDEEAVRALRRLCGELLPETDWHVVVYTYMGLYPRSRAGARELLARAARLAVATGSERLIVKTVAESRRIPTVAENVEALELAAAVAASARRELPAAPAGPAGGETYREALALIDAVLNCASGIGDALVAAFRRGLLDVPFCLHPDNAGRARSRLDGDGRLRWADLGSLPLAGVVEPRRDGAALTAAGLMDALSHVQRTFDGAALARPDTPSALVRMTNE